MPNHLSFALLVAASAEVRDIMRAEMWLQRHFPQFQCKHHNLVGNLCNQMGVSKNTGTPKWMVYNGKPYEQMDDLGIALFLETPKSWHFSNFSSQVYTREFGSSASATSESGSKLVGGWRWEPWLS